MSVTDLPPEALVLGVVIDVPEPAASQLRAARRGDR